MSPGTTSDRARTFTETARRAQIIEAAIDTIAEVGYARASLARIGERIGISKGLIGYHFAGKDELIKQVTYEVVEQMKAYMILRILAEAENGPRFLRAYIGSHLAFMREHRNHMVAMVEISRGSADGQQAEGPDGDEQGEDRGMRHAKRNPAQACPVRSRRQHRQPCKPARGVPSFRTYPSS